MSEQDLLHLALLAYGLAGWAVWRAPGRGWQLLPAAWALHTLALAWRWTGQGHGPFTTMHEILSSSLWSLAGLGAAAAWRCPEARLALRAAVPVWAVLASWLLMASPGAGHFPPTYDTPLLYLHTALGKLFLGLLLLAVGLGAAALGSRRQAPPVGAMPSQRRLDELAHRFAAWAFVSQSLMLVVGAVWAQDAWGRYWDWDPLERWAFASWLALAFVLHWRASQRPSAARHALGLTAVFALAFVTFFGVPYLSTVPHKGAV